MLEIPGHWNKFMPSSSPLPPTYLYITSNIDYPGLPQPLGNCRVWSIPTLYQNPGLADGLVPEISASNTFSDYRGLPTRFAAGEQVSGTVGFGISRGI